MSITHVPVSMRRKTIEVAANLCEYCQLSQDYVPIAHEIDHILAEVHGGQTRLDNLALACFDCNRHKSLHVASIDFETGILTMLFNPRKDLWEDHFELQRARIRPKTAIGRVTARILRLNNEVRLKQRGVLIDLGLYP